ncbi:MAG: phosphotransferase [Polyangiaceae bacterium]
MTEPWAAERVVDAELARQLVRSQFDLEADRVEPFGEGWDNTALLVDGEWLFRFPRRAVAVPLVELEIALLPSLAARGLGLAVPDPRHVGRPTARYPWPFAGYRLLRGRPASDVELSSEARGATAGPLGRFLRRLHDVPPSDAPGVAPEGLGRLDPARRAPLVRERLAKLDATGDLPLPIGVFEAIVEEAPGAGPPRTLCHGDLYSRHLLVDERGALTSVIDWGDAHVGDSAVDLAIVASFLPASSRGAFVQEYGSIDAETWARARFRALITATALVLYGKDRSDAAAAREGVWALRALGAS